MSAATRILSCLAVAIVLGIVGMHALTAHGAQPGGSHQGGTTTGAQPYAAPAAGTASTSTALAPVGDPGHGAGDLVMLCVWMLASAGALVLVLLALRRSPPRGGLLHRFPALRRSRAVDRLATGPPPCWQFSVIRC